MNDWGPFGEDTCAMDDHWNGYDHVSFAKSCEDTFNDHPCGVNGNWL